MGHARAILATLRPRQWVKNLFVVAPLVFSKHLFDPAQALRSALAAAAFCALSGAVYAFNDVRDVAEDRRHPRKRNRPIAAGALAESTAIAVAVVLAAGALAACAALAPLVAALGAAYLAIHLGYSLGLKTIAWFDVAFITGGFLLRVVAGAEAIAVPVSPWLLVCTALLAALLGFGKRAHELVQAAAAGREATATRASLGGYSLPRLRVVLVVLAAATAAAYAWYTQDARTVRFFGTRDLIWTLPFCALGIARFLQQTLRADEEDSPTDAILRDPLFLLDMAAWAATVVLIVY